MDIESLKCFLLLSEELHFSRAATRLRITQPHLTRVIKRLENQLGFALFVRTKRWVEITAAGRIFIESAKASLEMLDAGIAAAREHGTKKAKFLSIGFKPNSTLGPVGDFVRSFSVSEPACSLRLIEGSSASLMRDVASRRIDAAFILGHSKSLDVRNFVLRKEPVWVLMSDVGKSRRDRSVTVAQLAHQRWLLCPRRSNPVIYDLLRDYLLDHGVVPGLIQESPTYESTVAEVAAGLALSFVPMSYAKNLRPDTIALPPEGKAVSIETILICHKNDHRAHLNKFCDHAKSFFSDSTKMNLSYAN